MPKATTLRYFLGANSSQGFVSRFDQLGDARDGCRLTIIKGGPGTGKSSLMKKLAAAMADQCSYIEEIYCSSDLDSLDGVIFPELKLAIADGTPPHTLEPRYPGAYETILPLGDCWDEDLLYRDRNRIFEIADRCSDLHKNAAGYLYAAGSLLTQLQGMADDATDHRKIQQFAAGVAAREYPKTAQKQGKEKIRFLSGITNKGVHTFEETIAALAPRLYILEDSWCAASAPLLDALRRLALEKGVDAVSCACPLFPFTKLDHLLLPELGLGFVTSNKLHKITLAGERTIHARRFTDMEKLKTKKHRMSFLHRAAVNMLEQATQLIGEAKANHDRLEGYYIGAMDFAAVDKKAQQAIDRFTGLADAAE